MTHGESVAPRRYLGVMVSSTFTDLEEHRRALMRAIEGQGLHAVTMDVDAALPSGTVIDSSLQKVRDAAAYVGVISHRYGQIPESDGLNPERLSLTELEFREARRLGRPMLIFIMGPDHDVKPAAVERDPEKLAKLESFREEVKRSAADSQVQRVYKQFDSLAEFAAAATQSVAALRRFLDEQAESSSYSKTRARPEPDEADAIPRPPELYAEPRYIGSHAFVGRGAELETLSDWAGPAEAHPVLLYEAIGGTGKSMLTWEWTVNHARTARTDWAGVFWYSFYEKGAVMTDFSRRALAYMTGQPLRAFRKKRQPELTRLLQIQLQSRPWLLVLDGLERVLVAYHRYNAAQISDEDAGGADEVAHRDPSAAIRPADDELLRSLAVAQPSKVLITSRLVPQAMLNRAGQPLPGVLYERLAGLRPGDAEALMRACGVCGDSQLMRAYLQQHCDCHPLVTGIVAGLVNDYLPERGHFDSWAADPGFGRQLNLAELDLVQKRNHILEVAMGALPEQHRQILATLALLSEAVDYETMAALSPYLPPGPPEEGAPDISLRADERITLEDLVAQEEYEHNLRMWRASPEYQAGVHELSRTVRDLERRGLLQYDRQAGRYDLHPVVRGFVSGNLRSEERDRFGQRAVDYFSQRAHDPYEQAETLDDVRNGLQVVRTLLQMRRLEEALFSYSELSQALFFNLEAGPEILTLLRPFFGPGWTILDIGLADWEVGYLANDVARSFRKTNQPQQARIMHEKVLMMDIKLRNAKYLNVDLDNLAGVMGDLNRLAASATCNRLDILLAQSSKEPAIAFTARGREVELLIQIGRLKDAEVAWARLDAMGRDWSRAIHRPGDVEWLYAEIQLRRGRLTESILANVDRLAREGRNRPTVRGLHSLRAEWLMERGEWGPAAESLHDAIRMNHEAGMSATKLETRLALARFHLGQFPATREEASRLSAMPDPDHLALAELWIALGEPDRAANEALAAYTWACADGEPYVRRHQLDRAAALLQSLGAAIPDVPTYDPELDEPLPFEEDVRAVIRELREENDQSS